MYARILPVSLAVALLACACAPGATPAIPRPAATAFPTPAAPSPTSTAPAPTEQPAAVATSRGPNLEASDPLSVSLASGGLQLVEFFRFT